MSLFIFGYTMVADLCHVVLSCFRGEKAPRENPPNGDFFVFSHGDLSLRHTKVQHFSCVAFSPPVCRIFAWRGERSTRENPPKSPFGVFSHGDLSPRQAKIRQTGGERSRRENPPNDDFFVFPHGELSPRHTEVPDIPCVAFSATVCRIFARTYDFFMPKTLIFLNFFLRSRFILSIIVIEICQKLAKNDFLL